MAPHVAASASRRAHMLHNYYVCMTTYSYIHIQLWVTATLLRCLRNTPMPSSAQHGYMRQSALVTSRFQSAHRDQIMHDPPFCMPFSARLGEMRQGAPASRAFRARCARSASAAGWPARWPRSACAAARRARAPPRAAPAPLAAAAGPPAARPAATRSPGHTAVWPC